MTTQANWDVAPCLHQQVTTMASRLRDFTRMNPPTFYGSKVNQDPQDFLDEFYIILFDMGVTSIDKAEWEAYKLKDVAQTWYVHWREISR